jgi:hypothetical protein
MSGDIIEVLTSQPTAEQVLKLRPSVEFQARTSELLEKSKQGQLGTREAVELERYLFLEHIVRIGKAHAYRRLANDV